MVSLAAPAAVGPTDGDSSVAAEVEPIPLADIDPWIFEAMFGPLNTGATAGSLAAAPSVYFFFPGLGVSVFPPPFLPSSASPSKTVNLTFSVAAELDVLPVPAAVRLAEVETDRSLAAELEQVPLTDDALAFSGVFSGPPFPTKGAAITPGVLIGVKSELFPFAGLPVFAVAPTFLVFSLSPSKTVNLTFSGADEV